MEITEIEFNQEFYDKNILKNQFIDIDVGGIDNDNN